MIKMRMVSDIQVDDRGKCMEITGLTICDALTVYGWTGYLEMKELKEMFEDIDKRLTSLPAVSIMKFLIGFTFLCIYCCFITNLFNSL